MTQGKPLKQLLVFALPLMFGSVFQQLYTVVDTAIVGQGVGMNALAALGTVDSFNWMFVGIAQGFTQGFSVLISQKYGEQDFKGMKKTIGQSFLLSIAIAIVGLTFGQAIMSPYLNILRVPAELQPIAATYARTILVGFPIVMFYNYCGAVLRAIGNSQTPLKAMMVASVTNIGLDLIAVYVLKWGVFGAALATVIAQMLAGAICAIKIWKTEELRFGREAMKREMELCVTLTKLGAPVALQNMIIAFGAMVVAAVVNGFGTTFIAGYTATNKLYGILEIAGIAYGYAITTYVGQNYGARLYDRIRNGIRSALGLSIATSVGIGAAMIIFGRQITMMFISTESPEMAVAAGDTAYLFLFIMSVFLPILYLLHLYQSALRGMGNTVIPMISGIIEFVMRVGLALIVGLTGYSTGVFYAEVAAWAGAAFFMMFHYYRGIRKIH